MSYLIFSLISVFLIFSCVVYLLSKNVLKQKTYRYLSYSERAIRNQLFNLSKLIVVSIVMLVIILGTRLTYFGTYGNYLLPLTILLYWYCQYKLEPASFTGAFTDSNDSGVKAQMYSTERARSKSIIIQSCGLFFIALFIIGYNIKGITVGNPYSSDYMTTLIGSLDYAIEHAPFESKKSFIMAKLVLCTDETFVTTASLLGIVCSVISIIRSVINVFKVYLLNKQRVGKEVKLEVIFILIKKVLFNSAILLGYLAILYESLSVRVPQIVIFDDIRNGALLVGIEEYYSQAFDLYWLPFVQETSAINLSYVCSYLAVILLITFLVITDIKLLLLYRHQNKMIVGIKTQEAINNGTLHGLSRYKDCDFVENLINYQTLLTRFIYNPSILNNLEGTKKQLSWFVRYIDDLDCCKKCIFMGTPLALTSSITLSFSCYMHQMRFVREVKKEVCNEKVSEKNTSDNH